MSLFSNLRTPREVVNYNLMKGVTDWTNLKQFDYYETGFPFLIVIDYPKWIRRAMAYEGPEVRSIIQTYLHVLENEFIGLDGIENITTSTATISNGIRELSVINKVEQAAGQITMEYHERAGMPLTKFHRYYLTGIHDLETQAKTYHGLIDTLGFDEVQPGLDKEVFTFLYFTTDNTFSRVEAAHLFCCCQPTTADLSISEHKKGEIDFSVRQLTFNGLCLQNDAIDAKAAAALRIMRNPENKTNSRLIVNSTRFEYTELGKLQTDEEKFILTSKGDNRGEEGTGYHTDIVANMMSNKDGHVGGEHSIMSKDPVSVGTESSSTTTI